jgi:RecG-like helicase
MHKPIFAVPMLALAVLGLSSVASAQTTHIAGPATLHTAIQAKTAAVAADRAAVTRVLKTPDAQAVAARLGLNLTNAQAHVARLDGTDLEKAAASARALEAQSGGRNTIVIGTTTLLLLIIILILVID